MKKREEYSSSALKIYDSVCHKQYYFEYLDPYSSHWENKSRLKQVQVKAGRRKELIFGGILHDVLNDFFHLEESNRSTKSLLEFLKTRWGGPRKKEGGFPNIEEEREHYVKAVRMLKGFAKNQNLKPNITYLPKPKEKDEFVKENFFKVDIGNGLKLTGMIDRIDKENGAYHLIDYKTGKERKKEDNLQLMIYALLAEGALGMPLAKASYLYPEKGKLITFVPSKEAKDKALTRIRKIIEEIRADEEFEPQPSKMCYYCDFVELCPTKEEAKKHITKFKGKEDDLPF